MNKHYEFFYIKDYRVKHLRNSRTYLLLLILIASIKLNAQSPGGVNFGLKLWLRADTGTSVSVNGSSVTTWSDFSGMGNHATQSSSTQKPQYLRSATENLNFNPYLYFDGNDGLSIPYSSSSGLNSHVTAFVVNALDANATANWRRLIGNRGSSNSGFQYWIDPGNRTVWAGSQVSANVGLVAGIPEISAFDIKLGTSQLVKHYFNGSLIPNLWVSGIVNYSANTNNPYFIGSANNASNFWQGQISEIIQYDSVLSASDKQRVFSYLSIKFGIPMNQAGSLDYLATDSTVIWNATLNKSFSFNIAGIGRDDAELLSQKQSSVYVKTELNPIIGLGTIATDNKSNANVFGSDKSYLLWGDNNKSASTVIQVSNNKPGGLGVMNRMAKVWKVQVSGSVDSVYIAINASFLTRGDRYLIVSSDSSFNSGNTWYNLSQITINGSDYYAIKCLLQNGEFFTFSNNPIYPGGVSGAALWLKANDVFNLKKTDNDLVNLWKNEGVGGFDPAQSTSARMPLYKNNGADNINFNPVVKFNGSSQYLVSSSLLGTSAFNDASTFVVTNAEAIKSQSVFFESLLSVAALNLYLPHTDGRFYWDGATSNRVNLAWGASLNTPYLWTGWNSNTKSPKNAFYRNGLLLNSNSTNISFTGNNSNFYIGCQNLTNFYQGKMGEVLIYLKPLTLIEKQKIETYLAIKYGMTINQTTATDYISVSGTKIWNANFNRTYNKNIAGIGRDDIEDLNQKQSKSSNLTEYMAVALGKLKNSNVLNTNSFSSNSTYLTWGDNGGNIGYSVNITNNVPMGLLNPQRMGRVWKFQKTGSIDTIDVAMVATFLPGANKYLVVSSDSTFSTGNAWYKLDSIDLNNKTYYSSRLTINSGQFLTFVNRNAMPGGVDGVSIWLKADDGLNISLPNSTPLTSWTNNSGGMDASQATASKRPTYLNNTDANLNFNPVIAFDGTDDCMGIPYNSKFNDSITAFSIHTQNTTTTLRSPMGSRNAVSFKGWAYLVDNIDRQVVLGTNTAWNSISSGNLTTGKYELLDFNTIPGSSQAANLNVNHKNSSTGMLNYVSNTTNDFSVGASTSTLNFWNGNIAEQLVFGKILTSQERLKVNSYLAIKYGIGIDQNLPVNYLSTDATVIWNANLNRSFRFNIAGLGRDDIEALNQKQSASNNLGRQVLVSMNTIATNNSSNLNPVGDDKSYLVWGDNDGGMAFSNAISNNQPSGVSGVSRMSRVWKVQKTGTVNTVRVAIPGTYSTNSIKYLVVSSDSTFSSGNTWYALTNNITNNINYWGANVNFNSGNFFTFVGKLEMPGGVGSMSVWLKANDQVLASNNTTAIANHNKPISYWSNLGSGKDFVQYEPSKRPIFKFRSNNDFENFNPFIAFGSPFSMKMQGDLGLNNTKNMTVFAVNRNTTGTGFILQADSNLNNALNVSSSSPGQSTLGLNNSTTANGTASTVGSNYLSGGYRSGDNLFSMLNGAVVGTASSTTSFAKANGYVLNTNTAGNTYLGAGNATTELIVYPYTLSLKQRNQVATYLAIKNGFTLNYSAGTNYLASDSNLIVWNTASNALFNKNICIVGRDDISNLDQRMSMSCNIGNQFLLTYGNFSSSNLSHSAAFTGNYKFLACGDNDSAITFTTKVLNGMRLSRVWKVQNTGSVVNVRVNLASPVFSNVISNKYLIVSSDSTFKSSYTRYNLTAASLNGVNYYGATLTLNNGVFFTFADLPCNNPILTSTNTRTIANAGSCTVNGWLYYKDPANPTQSIVAIHPNGNTWNPDSVIVDFSSAGVYSKTSSINTTALSRRMLTIVAPGTFNANGGVKVRMFYDTSEHVGLPTTSQNWYKHKGNKFDVLKDLGAYRLDSCQLLFPNVSGVENGVNYVEFHNISSFSTFGFGGSTDLTALSINLFDFTAKAQGSNSKIEWKIVTDKEERIDFQLQRSVDGINWSIVYSSQKYLKYGIQRFAFTDSNPNHPISYYRLLVSQITGEHYQSTIERVVWNDDGDENKLYPNPSSGIIYLHLNEEFDGDCQLQILNSEGKCLKEMQWNSDKNEAIDLSNYPMGTYWIRVLSGEHYWIEKVIKLE